MTSGLTERATGSALGRRLVAYVGSYPKPGAPTSGGISRLELDELGRVVAHVPVAQSPREAGYLAYSPARRALYAVDERKTDGRGPVDPAASVHAFAVDPASGDLTWKNARLAPGPRPTYLALHTSSDLLLCANHGDFQHVERVVREPGGGWASEFVYDDSTVIAYGLSGDGALGPIQDLVVLAGHGPDPNSSPQAGGHAQASAHAHCAVFDPTGHHVIVCDKGTDRVRVYRLGATLEPAFTVDFAPQTAPRHIEFCPLTGLAFMSCEMSSELVALRFDFALGRAEVVSRVSTVAAGFNGMNEPAEVRVHPGGRFIYVNNRGEDSLAWFERGPGGTLRRCADVRLAKSLHPGVAARSFAFDPTGRFALVADRPANLVRSYRVDTDTGALLLLGEQAVSQPAYVAFALLEGAGS